MSDCANCKLLKPKHRCLTCPMGSEAFAPDAPPILEPHTGPTDDFVEVGEIKPSLGPRIRGELFLGDVPMKLLDRLARAALDATSYADHDADCPDRLRLLYKPEPCTCGYAETHVRVLRLAQQVADMKGKP